MKVPAIRLEAVSYVYQPDEVQALDAVSLRIESGERVALIGQNGSGKTTLARHLDGLLRPTSGRVFIGETDAAARTVAQLAKLVGLVFQDPARQIFAGSVQAEVEFGPRNVGLRGVELREAVDEALAVVGLSDQARTNPYDLGESRRKLLALAAVLAMRTPVLVLDEPTTGQDLAGTTLVRDVIGAVAAEGRTVIAISHDMEFVADAFERVVVMRAGRVIDDGPPARVFDRPAWDALRSTNLEPPLAARVGARLRVQSTPTHAALIAAVAAGLLPAEARQ
ncbi:MAG TPA: ATP-binding cassette domain-containing protein [Candidatus Limnocylindria bacterium]|nr:ATP-binding cassette domain-containing protein [Candidatus Limnocylindria bacterium]